MGWVQVTENFGALALLQHPLQGLVDNWLSLGVSFSRLDPTLEIAVKQPILEALRPAFLASRVEAALVQGRGPGG